MGRKLLEEAERSPPWAGDFLGLAGEGGVPPMTSRWAGVTGDVPGSRPDREHERPGCSLVCFTVMLASLRMPCLGRSGVVALCPRSASPDEDTWCRRLSTASLSEFNAAAHACASKLAALAP